MPSGAPSFAPQAAWENCVILRSRSSANETVQTAARKNQVETARRTGMARFKVVADLGEELPEAGGRRRPNLGTLLSYRDIDESCDQFLSVLCIRRGFVSWSVRLACGHVERSCLTKTTFSTTDFGLRPLQLWHLGCNQQ